MDSFLVLYKAPNAVIDEWMKKPEQERKSDETEMMDAWKKWMSANASKFTDKGAGAGKPKVVSSSESLRLCFVADAAGVRDC